MDIAAWLHRLGLEQYEQAFRDNDIDAEVLPDLTADDLISIGVTSVGHRRKLLAAIAALREKAAPAGEKTIPITPPAQKDDPSGLASPSAERRQLTVMFCDLVGSTALSSQLDPEDLREVIAAYHHAVSDVVRSFDGFVAKYMGDGVLAYFGYPRAHEDDAERAVRAGLGAIDAVRRLDVNSGELQARVGIATGLVVVGDLIGEGSAQEQAVVGETPNLAARLQALAEPGAVVIAAGTRRLVGDLFEYRDLGSIELKGIAGPAPAWQVLGPSAVESRFEALRGSSSSPLIGRDEEIDLLLRRWARAKAGDGQVVLVSGEPGLGKSRLTTALNERLDAEPNLRLRYFCSPYHQDSALFPFIDQLDRAAGFAREDLPAPRLEKLEAVLARAGPPDEDVALLADLLCLPCSERCPLPNLTPQRKKERTLEALIRQLEGLARLQPVVMVFEDAHWIDPTSRELLDLIVERVRSLPVLLVVTFRPEFHPPWAGQPQVTMLTLNRLDRRDRTALVTQIVGGKALPDEVIDQIADRTDGVPLFVEELTKSMLESGLLREESDRYVLEGAMPPFAIPTTLHASLMARLERSASARRVAQTGAAIGREFSYSLLNLVSGLPEDELQAALGRLVASELVFQRGSPPDAVYTFKHALVQDAAHSSLLRNARQQLHTQIADALEAHSPELMNSQPELFAQHYAEAGLAEKSAACWGEAGSSSAARSAMAEAAAQFQKALDQLALLPDSPKRKRRQLELWTALGAVLRFVKGQGAPETGYSFSRARDLWEQLGSPSEFLHVPYGQSRYHVYRGELGLGLSLDEDLLRLSRERDDSAGFVLGHQAYGTSQMLAGRFALSRLHLEAALAIYDPNSHGSLAHQTGSYPQVVAQAYLGFVLFCLGFPDQAVKRTSAAIAEAERLAHSPSLASSLMGGTILLSLAGYNGALDQRADDLVTVATDQGFLFWRPMGIIYRGWVKVQDGDAAEGISLLHDGLAGYRATGAQLWMPYYTAFLARAYEIAGEIEEALARLKDASHIAETTGERWFAAELHRHKGRLLLRQGRSGAAEEQYRKALSIAEEQGATLWELRATVSLARLRRNQSYHADARNLLTSIYARFTEGFATPDLKEASALLGELS
jgi:class 3 adenylate cyclase/predicted ATPase